MRAFIFAEPPKPMGVTLQSAATPLPLHGTPAKAATVGAAQGGLVHLKSGDRVTAG